MNPTSNRLTAVRLRADMLRRSAEWFEWSLWSKGALLFASSWTSPFSGLAKTAQYHQVILPSLKNAAFGRLFDFRKCAATVLQIPTHVVCESLKKRDTLNISGIVRNSLNNRKHLSKIYEQSACSCEIERNFAEHCLKKQGSKCLRIRKHLES